MDIYDCFPFNDEVEILMTRIMYLEPVVKYFVIAESDQTFSGIQKKYFADDAIESLGMASSRFIRVKYKFPDSLIRNTLESGDRWPLERFARDALSSIVREINPDDCVILSDVDEIPSRDQVVRASALSHMTRISTPEFYGKANWIKRGSDPWLTVKIGPASSFNDLNLDRYSVVPITTGIEGSHFSDMYDAVDAIKRKARSSAHSEFDLPDEKLREIAVYADKFKVDYRGRFFRKGMGLVNQTRVLNEQQNILATLAPKFIDMSPTPNYRSRVCASYNLAISWGRTPIALQEKSSILWFWRAISHHLYWKLVSFSKKLHRKAARLFRTS
jgi:hypothetical protein